ncbi:MAG: M18 family aminopeptidase, partial [Nitrosomonadales bacterium]|nr:M18 family aminopeptidase [Nitrosomonadales bacterium]
GGSIIAFRMGSKPLGESGLRIVGAHTDSPGLRLKPKAAFASDGIARLAVEVYGGPILATFTDRDLSLAGRVNVRKEKGFDTHLVRFDQALVRLPNLAIHMNREVNDQGLKLHKQNELPLVFSFSKDNETAMHDFRQLLAKQLSVEVDLILNWEVNVYDTQKGAFWGAQQEFIADSQLDNLASCHAGITALLETDAPNSTAICALFDHEEVGSESATGAGGSFIADVLARIAASQGLSEEMKLAAFAESFLISADMAHAYHPNFPNAYEPGHKAMVNAGPVIKLNANQRYSSDADSAARFMLLCEKAGVPYQQYAHRTDLGCGSTIGPIVAANLGITSVDVGCPMWAMHSIRESAGVLDHYAMIQVLKTAFKS